MPPDSAGSQRVARREVDAREAAAALLAEGVETMQRAEAAGHPHPAALRGETSATLLDPAGEAFNPMGDTGELPEAPRVPPAVRQRLAAARRRRLLAHECAVAPVQAAIAARTGQHRLAEYYQVRAEAAERGELLPDDPRRERRLFAGVDRLTATRYARRWGRRVLPGLWRGARRERRSPGTSSRRSAARGRTRAGPDPDPDDPDPPDSRFAPAAGRGLTGRLRRWIGPACRWLDGRLPAWRPCSPWRRIRRQLAAEREGLVR